MSEEEEQYQSDGNEEETEDMKSTIVSALHSDTDPSSSVASVITIFIQNHAKFI